MDNKDKIILKGECTGNNDNGCFMESPGHDCGCFKRMYSEEEVETIAKDAYDKGKNYLLTGVFNKWFEQYRKK